MKHTLLIRLGGLAAMVGGIVYAIVGSLEGRFLVEYLFHLDQFGGEFFVAVSLPLGASAAIAALHVLQRERYASRLLGTLASLMVFVGLAIPVGVLTVRVVVDGGGRWTHRCC